MFSFGLVVKWTIWGSTKQWFHKLLVFYACLFVWLHKNDLDCLLKILIPGLLFQSFLSGFGLFSAPSCTLCSSPKSQFLLPNSGIPLDSSCVPLHVLWPENCLWAVIYVSGTTGFSCVMPIVSCGFHFFRPEGDSCPYRSVLARSRSSYLFFEC